MKKLLILLLLCISLIGNAATYYVSTTGSDAAAGTIGTPWLTWQHGFETIVAGDILYIRGGTYLPEGVHYGTYYGGVLIVDHSSGTITDTIKVFAYPGEVPILDCSNINFVDYRHYGIYLENTSYWHFKGLKVTRASQVSGQKGEGIYLYNTNNMKLELLDVYLNGGTGVRIGGTLTDNNNLILNCDFHHNYDPLTATAYDDADGLDIAFVSATSTNTVRGCRFWNNSDDGIDLWANEGFVLVDSCWSWMNGYREDGTTTGGDGNGYKLGATVINQSTTHLRTVTNSQAFHNRSGGFVNNAALCVSWLFNNTAYHNADQVAYRLGFEFNETVIVHILRNNIAYANQHPTDLQASYGNCITSNNTWNGGVTITDADFASLDTTGVSGARQSNGSLPLLRFLHLVSTSDLIDAGVNVGLPFGGNTPDIGAFEYILRIAVSGSKIGMSGGKIGVIR